MNFSGMLASCLHDVRKLAAPRRKVMLQKFATHAARRLHALRDPGIANLLGQEKGNLDDD